MAQPPAAIRYNNPGAQYPGPSAQRFGSIGTQTIGGGHKIAVFDDPVKGAAAQFDLLGRGYAGMTLGQLINKWSGGNSSAAYANYVSSKTGIPVNAPVTAEMLRDPNFAVPFAKAKAEWETGRPYPMTDEQWNSAHRMAFGGEAPAPAAPAQQTQVAGTNGITGEQQMFPFALAAIPGMAAAMPGMASAAGAAGAAAPAAAQAAAPALSDMFGMAQGGQGLNVGPFQVAGNQGGANDILKSLGGGGQQQQPQTMMAGLMQPDQAQLGRIMQVLQNRARLGTA